MSVVVDTSVWSLALRRRVASEDPQVVKLADILRQGQPVFLLGVILQEILQGIRDARDFARVKMHLEIFPFLQMEREDYTFAAELSNTCRSHGIQASTIDFQIAAACVRQDCLLLTCDQDFQHMARYSALQLL